MIRSRWLWSFLFAGTLAAAAWAGVDGGKEKKPAADGEKAVEAIFDRLKSLEGEWVAASSSEQVTKGQVVSRYRLTGGGTALTETIFPGTPMEMLSVYHRDGRQLVMTHYCCMGNQPKMRLRTGKDNDEVVLEFAGGTNLDPDKDSHIHSGVIRFVDASHLHAEWDFYIDGKSGQKHAFDLVKKTK
jgi:hypothetical protein